MPTVTSNDGTQIAYDSVGSGPPLILVAGATQYRAVDQTTPELARLLAAGGFRVINYDRRGRGDSGDTQPYAVEREIEDIEALVTEAGGEASLFGMSSGAVLAAEAAARGVPVDEAPDVRAADGAGRLRAAAHSPTTSRRSRASPRAATVTRWRTS